MLLNPSKIKQAIKQIAGDEPVCAYIYDLPALLDHIDRMLSHLPDNCELFYAVKANSDLPILQTLAACLDGFEVASGGELSLLYEAFPDVKIAFGGPGKSDAELALALKTGVELIHVESFGELQRLACLAESGDRQVSVLLRVNPPLPDDLRSTLTMCGRASQFGMDPVQLEYCLNWLSTQSNVVCRGFHFHMLSHQLQVDKQLSIAELCFRYGQQLSRRLGLAKPYMNIGGGFGINYRQPEHQFDWPVYCRGLKALIERYELQSAVIRLEPGRYVSAACGYYAMQIIDLKQSYGTWFAIGRGGTHHFRTPYAQSHSHPFFIVANEHWPYPFRRQQLADTRVTITGQLCTPKDLLAYDAPIDRLRVGDIVAFPYAGAYAWHISHHDFLKHPHPQHIYLTGEDLPNVVG